MPAMAKIKDRMNYYEGKRLRGGRQPAADPGRHGNTCSTGATRRAWSNGLERQDYRTIRWMQENVRALR